MASWLKRLGIAGVLVLLVAQAYRPARTNPPVDPNREMHSLVAVDPALRSAIERSCNDCHSNRTEWPWYSEVAPASWLVVPDVNRGRAALNFSEWSRYDAAGQNKRLKEICSEVSEGEMPAAQYLLMHPHAKLSPAQKAAVCRWTRTLGESEATASAEE